MVKKLAGGRRVVALFSRDAEHQLEFELQAEWLGGSGEIEVLDGWRQNGFGVLRAGGRVKLGYHRGNTIRIGRTKDSSDKLKKVLRQIQSSKE